MNISNKKDKKDKRAIVHENFQFFRKFLSENQSILEEEYSKFALIRNKEIFGYYSSWDDANQAGNLAYEDGLFSIQEITDNKVDLGYFSHAIIQG